MARRKECPVCDAPVESGEDWTLQTPLREKFTYCSVDCLIYGADNLDLDDAEDEE
jgi:hypothetical protein